MYCFIIAIFAPLKYKNSGVGSDVYRTFGT